MLLKDERGNGGLIQDCKEHGIAPDDNGYGESAISAAMRDRGNAGARKWEYDGRKWYVGIWGAAPFIFQVRMDNGEDGFEWSVMKEGGGRLLGCETTLQDAKRAALQAAKDWCKGLLAQLNNVEVE